MGCHYCYDYCELSVHAHNNHNNNDNAFEIQKCEFCFQMHCHYCYDYCEHELTAPVIQKCKEDAIANEYNIMLCTLYSVLVDEYHFDLDDLKIIQILSDYALGTVVFCSKKDCQNE